MRKTCHIKCKFMYGIDLFGKEAELYYNGKSKRTSWTGILFTILYISMYISFFIYKVVRMLRKDDVTFYDTYAFTGEPPKIQLTKDKFYGGFALGNPLTLQTFVDDSIYYVEAYYRKGVKEGSIWKWETIPLELETCKLENFGEKYRDIFKDKSIDQLHCVAALNHVLQGHLSYDVYSYYYVKFFPCINGKRNRTNCKPLSVVQQYLTQTFVTFKMEDVDLTPQFYDTPISLRGKEVSANVGKSLFQDVHSYFQIINIETDEDIVGFGWLSQIKKEKYIKYDQSVILNSLKDDIFETGDAICDVSIALSEQELTQIRTYPKLIVVLGDVGGLMEVFFSVFRIISSFLMDTLYETSLVNHLFSFDLDKKLILIKHKKKNKKKNSSQNELPKLYSPIEIISQNSPRLSDEMTIQTKNKLNEEPMKSKMSNDIVILSKPKNQRKKKKAKTRYSISSNIGKIVQNEIKNEKEVVIKGNNMEFSSNNMNYSNSKEEIDKKKDIIKDKGKEKRKIINKIRINKACTYLCFLCVRKRKNIQNVLIDEGMKVIREKLDIINLFKNIYRNEKMQERDITKEETIEMSEKCKTNLKNLYKGKAFDNQISI